MDGFKLNNGLLIPEIGFGTYQTPTDKEGIESIVCAIQNGYRHIDGAAFYANEQTVGKGIRESGIQREELFVTSKVWATERGYDRTLKSFDRTMDDLGLDYLDLFLIHWPATPNVFDNWRALNIDTWRALERVQKEGRVRSIGVSNFKPSHLKPLMEEAEIQPVVDQIEYHPGWMQPDIVEFCRANNIVVEAWSPLGTGAVLQNPVLCEIAEAYGKSVAQICVKWVLQNGVLPLVKSVTPKRIRENISVFDFELSAEDMKRINALTNIGGQCVDIDKIQF